MVKSIGSELFDGQGSSIPGSTVIFSSHGTLELIYL